MKGVLKTVLVALVVVLVAPAALAEEAKAECGEGETRRQARETRDHGSRRSEMGRRTRATPRS